MSKMLFRKTPAVGDDLIPKLLSLQPECAAVASRALSEAIFFDELSADAVLSLLESMCDSPAVNPGLPYLLCGSGSVTGMLWACTPSEPRASIEWEGRLNALSRRARTLFPDFEWNR